MENILNLIENHQNIRIFSPINQIEYSFWPYEQVTDLNKAYEVEINVPGYLAVGSDGGNEMLAINLKTNEIFSIPFIPMDISNGIKLFNSINEIT